MFRSLTAKLIATYLITTLASLLALGLLLGSLLQLFFFRDKARTLIHQGEAISRMIASTDLRAIESEELAVQIKIIGNLVGTRIWIVTPEGTVVQDSHRRGPLGPLAREDLDQVLAGKIAVRQGSFGHRFEMPVISVGVPLYVRGRPAGRQVAGAIFLHAPVLGVRLALAEAYRLLFLAALAAAAVAVVLSVWLSRRLARPLREMSDTAQELARGRFDRRVSAPRGDDEIARLAGAFNHMAARLGEVERLRGEFIANASHELRSPLTSMRGFIQGILDGTIPAEERDRYLHLAFDETKRLSRLVNDLLDLAAIEAGDVSFTPADVDVAELMNRAAAKMEPQAGEKGVSLTVDPPPTGDGPGAGAGTEPAEARPLTVRADPDRLEQVLINLLDNAIRFTPQGGAVTLFARPQGQAVGIAVRDTGPGIPPEDLDRIWERFYKGDRARTRSKGGTGLGLAIARELVERQGGTIRVESTAGEGATFFVSLPIGGVSLVS